MNKIFYIPDFKIKNHNSCVYVYFDWLKEIMSKNYPLAWQSLF